MDDQRDRNLQRAARAYATAVGVSYTAALRTIKTAQQEHNALIETQVTAPTYPAVPPLFTDPDIWPKLLIDPSDKPSMAIAIGLDKDRTPVTIDLAHGENPHLFIGRGVGGNKYYIDLLHSIILQLTHNNTPDQWQGWVIHPGRNAFQEFVRYQHLSLGGPYLDLSTVSIQEGYQLAAQLCEDLVAEMERRYSLFLELPSRPKGIWQARQDPSLSEPLPYITIFLPETLDLIDPQLWIRTEPETAEDQRRVLHALTWLARKSRAAGISLVAATEHPNRQTMPSLIKANSQRIGFQTSGQLESHIMINGPDLADIKIDGEGIWASPHTLRSFQTFGYPDFWGDTDVKAGGPHSATPDDRSKKIREILRLI